MQNKNKLSVFISLVLRHKPEVIGIEIQENGGWAKTSELISGVNRIGKYRLDMPLLEEIVRTDEKQRYSFNEDKTLIRANQGHSISVYMDFQEKQPPEILWHGTGKKSVDSIYKDGICKMNRNYVHLSKDRETAVKVGARHGEPRIFKISAGEMYRKGYKFYLSENGIWLIDHVPAEFIELNFE